MNTPHIADAVFNLRDLGGLPTVAGGVTRAGLLLRSATLQDATADDIDELARLLRGGVVIDLRAREEAVGEGHPWLPGVRYFNIPLRSVDGVANASAGKRLAAMYRSIVREEHSAAEAINLIGAALPNPTLIHCAAGKDRTGVITALTLGIAGARTESIMADYARTAEALPTLMAHLTARPRYRAHKAVLPAELYEVNVGAMASMIELIDADYGGFTGWAQHAGVRADVITAIRATLAWT